MPTVQEALNARFAGRAAVEALDATGDEPTERQPLGEAAAAAESPAPPVEKE